MKVYALSNSPKLAHLELFSITNKAYNRLPYFHYLHMHYECVTCFNWLLISLLELLWLEPKNDLMEALTSSEQAINAHALGLLMDQHYTNTWTLFLHAHAHFLAHFMLAGIFCSSPLMGSFRNPNGAQIGHKCSHSLSTNRPTLWHSLDALNS